MKIVKILRNIGIGILAFLALLIFTGSAGEAADIAKAIGGGIADAWGNFRIFVHELLN